MGGSAGKSVGEVARMHEELTFYAKGDTCWKVNFKTWKEMVYVFKGSIWLCRTESGWGRHAPWREQLGGLGCEPSVEMVRSGWDACRRWS